jgi:predicted MPP superfamily phosphohydrolase
MVRMVVFMLVAAVVWPGLHWLLGRRLIGGLELSRRGERIVWATLAFVAGIPVLGFIGARALDLDFLYALQPLAFLLMGVSSVVLSLWGVAELVRFVGTLPARLRRDAPPADPSRRGFLAKTANLGVMGGTASVVGVGVAQASQAPKVVEVDVPIVGLPKSAEGFRIVQLSDVHIGPSLKKDFMAQCVAIANGLNPDLVAVTGDLVDGWVDKLGDDVSPLRQLRARHGAFFVTGNHEYYWDGPAWCDEVARCGLTVLVNEHRVIEHEGARLLIAGVTDHSAGNMAPGHESDPAAARAGASAHDVSVLLAHQPRSIGAAARAGYDLQISGHTHGGQYFPFNWAVYLAQPYVAGLHRHDDTWIYVSRGTGYWGPPLRVGAQHEITLLRLVAA